MAKFAAGVTDTGTTGVVDTGGKYATDVAGASGKFATSVLEIGGAPSLSNISANFRKNSKWP